MLSDDDSPPINKRSHPHDDDDNDELSFPLCLPVGGGAIMVKKKVLLMGKSGSGKVRDQ